MSLAQYLAPTRFLDTQHPGVAQYCANFNVSDSDKTKAIALYTKVRDGFLYNPYHLDLRPEALVASTILGKRKAWCVEKAIVFATCARYLGIPTKLGFAIVKNHLESEKLEHYLKTDQIVFHGYVSVLIEDKWVKCTPAFDKRLCNISGVTVLDWDAENDALLQAFNGKRQFMEYLSIYGEFDDVPVELMHKEMKKYYPHLFENPIVTPQFSFKFIGFQD